MTTELLGAGRIPVNESVPVVTYGPITIPVEGRPLDLDLKVSAPATGDALPIILFSHGHGTSLFLSSREGYVPLTDFWAAHGFVVIKPTHPDCGVLGLRDEPVDEAPLYWRTRAQDMHTLLDHLDDIEAATPGLAGRLDRDRIAIAGHSLGGHTVCMLLGMQVANPEDGSTVDLGDERVKAGVALAAPGSGHDLADYASEHYSVLKASDFTTMSTPALVVAGDADQNDMFSARLSYRSDAYTLGPSPKTLLTLFGAKHILGGVSGFDAKETSDEDPERVATLRALTWAYLRSTLYPDDPAWSNAVAALETDPDVLGQVGSK